MFEEQSGARGAHTDSSAIGSKRGEPKPESVLAASLGASACAFLPSPPPPVPSCLRLPLVGYGLEIELNLVDFGPIFCQMIPWVLHYLTTRTLIEF